MLLTIDASLAATYEVAQRDPQASDDNPGTAERPWKSLSKAAEQVRAGDVVRIHSGTYRERVVLKESGTADAPIRIEATAGERVVVTGADQLMGWRRMDAQRPIYSGPWPHRFISWSPSMTHL
jgi:hypothetical protein